MNFVGKLNRLYRGSLSAMLIGEKPQSHSRRARERSGSGKFPRSIIQVGSNHVFLRNECDPNRWNSKGFCSFDLTTATASTKRRNSSGTRIDPAYARRRIGRGMITSLSRN